MEALLKESHSFDRKMNARVINRMDQLDDWMLLVPSYGTGEIECCGHRVEQSAVPMLFKNAPKTFDRIVFTVIRGII